MENNQTKSRRFRTGGTSFIYECLIGTLHALFFAVKIEVEADVQDYAGQRGHRRGKANLRQARVRLDAHHIRKRQADEQRLDETLCHDPERLVVAVEVAEHAEEDRRQDGLGREALQILKAFLHDLGIRREKSRQRIALEHHEREYGAAKKQPHADARQHRLLCALLISRAHVLRDERRHRLHQRAGNQHGEVDDLARNAVARRRRKAQPVDKRTQRQKRQLRQKLLQGKRQTDAQKLLTLRIESKVRA